MRATTAFEDRRQAGRQLAEALAHLRGREDVVVLALPRGGVPVAYEVAAFLRAPLDVFVVRKLGFPGQEEYAMGAIASGGVRVLNADVAEHELSAGALKQVLEREELELARRERLYRGERALLALKGRVAVIVDDGLATGSSMRAAVLAVRQHAPARVVVAVPVAAPEACANLSGEVDEIVCPLTPDPFGSVGRWYRDFAQTSDSDVQALLAEPPTRLELAPTPTRAPFRRGSCGDGADGDGAS